MACVVQVVHVAKVLEDSVASVESLPSCESTVSLVSASVIGQLFDFQRSRL